MLPMRNAENKQPCRKQYLIKTVTNYVTLRKIKSGNALLTYDAIAGK